MLSDLAVQFDIKRLWMLQCHTSLFEVTGIENVQHFYSSYQNPSNNDHCTKQLLFCTYIMNKHELHIAICDVERGTHKICLLLSK